MTDFQQFQNGQEGDDQFDSGSTGPENGVDGHRPLSPAQGISDTAHALFDAVDFLLYADFYGCRFRKSLTDLVERLVKGLCIDAARKVTSSATR